MAFQKSSYCKADSPMCVEVNTDDSRYPEFVFVKRSNSDLKLHFTNDEWRTFIEGVKAGEFDI